MKNLVRGIDCARLVLSRLALKVILRHSSGIVQTVIFAPSLAWRTPLFQRPHQLARALAHQGTRVFFMEPGPSRRAPLFRRLNDQLYLCNVTTRAFRAIHKPLVYLLTWNRHYRAGFESPRVIYDFLDSLEVCIGDPVQVRREHDDLLRTARLVLTTSETLYQQAQMIRNDALLCPNGVDYAHFAISGQRRDQPPDDLAPLLAQGKPMIGYYGALARWFDYPLVEAVATSRPDLVFILIGLDYDGSLKASGLLNLPNVHWLGLRNYSDLPRYLHSFDVAMIPFELNTITHATSPLKLFEYLAGGKPVVVTPMQESLRYEGVLVASSPGEFSRQLDRALELRSSPDYLALIDRVARENTWEVRARHILEALQ
jgi:glycosyltransferase involved in cell wall biosynthesis